MTILRYEGVVDVHYDKDLWIGGVNVIEDIRSRDLDFDKPVTIAFADERFTGDLYAWESDPGYSEWTPGWDAEFSIDTHDLLERLEKEYDGKKIILWIADEPINTLDPPPSWANQEGGANETV